MAPLIKPTPITGFPEFLPEMRLVEQHLLDTVRQIFERHGFCSIETPLVERLEVLLSKSGDSDKEMYVLGRLQDKKGEEEARYGLHYDLTVPLARYVAQHEQDLTFPFKRYQIQDSFRGERPKLGRYRQFKQCDIDVIGRENLSLEYDALIPAIVLEVLQKCTGMLEVELRLSNRKVLAGFCAALKIEDPTPILRALDKILKIGPDGVQEELTELGLDAKTIDLFLTLGQIKTEDTSFVDKIKALGIKNDLLEMGLDELVFCFNRIKAYNPSAPVVVDLSLIRGFDYYTGSVYEVALRNSDFKDALGGGGRYDNLASTMTKTKLPGVGMTFGISRLLGLLVDQGIMRPNRKSPVQVLVVNLEEDKQKMIDLGKQLRGRGINTELYLEGGKLQKQLKYANDKKIPYVWFDSDNTLKNMETGEQIIADPTTWIPDNK